MGTESQRHARRKRGQATWRLVRYADDFVVMVAGTHAHAEALRDKVAGVLATMGLRLSEAKCPDPGCWSICYESAGWLVVQARAYWAGVR
jgi:hypothetical protein